MPDVIARQGTMMVAAMPTQEMTVAEVLNTWPETVEVFQAFKTACVGCAMAPFDTLADVARIYELELDAIIGALHQTIQTNRTNQPLPDSNADNGE